LSNLICDQTKIFTDRTKLIIDRTKLIYEQTKLIYDRTKLIYDRTKFYVDQLYEQEIAKLAYTKFDEMFKDMNKLCIVNIDRNNWKLSQCSFINGLLKTACAVSVTLLPLLFA
jgi:hypothetical protein